MNYFKLFSLIWGVVMIVLRSMIHLFPKKWNEFELNVAYKEQRPKWIWMATIISIIIVGFTWYKEITTNITHSIFLSALVTLTLIKIWQLLFNYNRFREFVKKALLEDRRIIRRIDLTTTVLGITLILLSIFVY